MRSQVITIRSVAAAACCVVIAAACEQAALQESSSGPPLQPPASSPVGTGTASPSGGPTTPTGRLPRVPPQRLIVGSAARAMRALCPSPEPLTGPVEPPDDVPAELQEIEDQVASVRGLEWVRPVVADPVDDAELDELVSEAFRVQYPAEQYARRTIAWRTIGVIGPGDDLREALLSFGEGQVAGFYNAQNGELVFRSSGDIGLEERFTLAHELTHAIDDQHFDLRRIDTLAAQCRDEEIEGALGAVEGSAQYFATQVLTTHPPSFEDIAAGLGDVLVTEGAPADVPPFVTSLAYFPYTAGQAFVTSLFEAGGQAAVDAALRRWPPSTEQILHPERYPADRPTPVDVPDVGRALGSVWGDLDVMQIGEEWLREMLSLRLDRSVAEEAAAGWDGGGYRAWSDKEAAAVVVRTVWDTGADATAFAAAVNRWLAAGDDAAKVRLDGVLVDIAFASDARTASEVNAAFAAVPAPIRT